MAVSNFFYRQGQRFIYHVSGNALRKRIAEINRNGKIVSVATDIYLINGIDAPIPRKGFEFLFQEDVFQLFLQLPQRLTGYYHVEGGKLFLCFSDLKIEITSKSELYILNEVFGDQCYNFLLPCDSGVQVVDIGMNVGIASLFFAGMPKVKSVHSYEPFPSAFVQAQGNFANNSGRATKIRANNFGLGLHEESLSALYDCANSGLNTTVTESRWTREGRTETIQIKSAFETINGLFKLFPEDQFVLKIDTEGSEYMIFDSLFGQELSDQVKVIMLEWHFHGAEKLERTLLASGFMLTSFSLNANSGLIYALR